MSNDLDPDQDRRFVGPDLGPNCLQRVSATKAAASKGKVDVICAFFLYQLYIPLRDSCHVSIALMKNRRSVKGPYHIILSSLNPFLSPET